MRKLTKFFIPVLLAILVFLPVTQADQVVAASKYEEGEYDLSFNVLKSGSSETSAAAEYLSSAKLIVKDGTNTVQMNVSNSSMLKSLTVDGATANTVSSDEAKDTRVVQFTASNLDGNLNGTMHVVVPAEVLPPNGYDEEYNVQFSFNTADIPTQSSGGGAGDEKEDESEADNSETEEDGNGVVPSEDNPKTGDSAPILLFTIVLLASGFVLIRKVAFK